MVCFVLVFIVWFLMRCFIGEYDESLGECFWNSRWGGDGGFLGIKNVFIE